MHFFNNNENAFTHAFLYRLCLVIPDYSTKTKTFWIIKESHKDFKIVEESLRDPSMFNRNIAKWMACVKAMHGV